MKNSKQAVLVLVGALFFSCIVMKESKEALAYHNFFFRSASDLTSGILPNERLDPSSVTLQGNDFSIPLNQMPAILTQLRIDTSTLRTDVNALSATPAIRAYTVIVGTSQAKGADIYGTRTEVFAFAIATAIARGGGTILVQSGDYFFNRATTITVPISIIFEPSATIKFGENEQANTIFFVSSGSIIDCNVYFATAIFAVHSPMFQIGRDAYVRRPKIHMRITETTATGDFSVVNFGDNAIDSTLDTPIISSYSVVAVNTAADAINIFRVNGATRCTIIEPTVMGKMSANKRVTRAIFNVTGLNNFRVIGGKIELNERLLATNIVAVSNRIMRGFQWTNPIIVNYSNPDTNGIIYFETNAGLVFSSGNVLSGFQIYHEVITTNDTMNIGAGGAGVNSMVFDNFNIYHTAGSSTGGGFTVASGDQNIFTNNKIWGTTDCFTDSGVNTRWTTNDNFCNGTEQ